jgi:hypothetical protein
MLECMTTLASGHGALGTRRQRLLNRLWQAAAALTHPVKPTEYLDMLRPLRAGADLRARVVEVRPETADAVTVVLRPGGRGAATGPASTSASASTSIGVRLWRSYSLTSAPARPTAC